MNLENSLKELWVDFLFVSAWEGDDSFSGTASEIKKLVKKD